jgi:uncharacterized protein
LPFRKCIGCANVKNRAEMIRIMKLYDTGEIIINPTSRHFGRSFYICYNIECVNKILKKKKLQKILKREVPAEIIEYLEKVGQ